MDISQIINIGYLVAAALFFLGFKRLSSPATARSGNGMASVGMLIAVVVTLLSREIVSYQIIIAGAVIGAAVGAFAARTVKMTAMPQMVGVFNGFGGGASATVAVAQYLRTASQGAVPVDGSVTIAVSVLIGVVTFSGSAIAAGKLQGLVTEKSVRYPMQNWLNLALFLGILALGGGLIAVQANVVLLGVLVAAALVLGILLVLPIGGADMPVVIALLNSYSGLAAAAAGFVVDNAMLIIAGSLVGASGFILTNLMCRAMNRSLFNVMFGAFGVAAGEAAPTGGRDGQRAVRSVDAEDAAIALSFARRVIFVPGYGLAVAQAQHEVRELAELLESKGVVVKYAIHPVAGRMPGHMNVLLAEANVPYDRLFDLDQINSEFDQTDVSIVVGANDVTNPAARDEPGSPIYGMPILNVDRAKSILIIKRSLSPGFAGIDNRLFYSEKTMMFFSDAKAALGRLVPAVKAA